MSQHPLRRFAVPLISAGTFLTVSAAWLYDCYILTPWSDHTLFIYFFATGPYVLIGVFGVVNSVVRANRFSSILGLVVVLLISGWGLLMWSRYLSGHDRDQWGLAFGTFYLWGVALVVLPMGWIAVLLYKVWQWLMGTPSQADPAAAAARPRD
jgi:hypothetical protein